MNYTVRIEIVDETGNSHFEASLTPATSAALIGQGRKDFNLLGTMEFVAKALMTPPAFRHENTTN